MTGSTAGEADDGPALAGVRPHAAVLSALAEELSQAARDLEDLQAVLAGLEMQAAPSPETVRRLQTIDRLTQTLEDLTTLAAYLSDRESEAALPAAEIAGCLRLGAGRHRVLGLASVQTDTGAGQIDWF